MYNLVSCYDTLEMETRGDVLSDKVTFILAHFWTLTCLDKMMRNIFMFQVCLSDNEQAADHLLGLRMSRSESILTDMTHVISPMSHNSFQPKSPLPSAGK